MTDLVDFLLARIAEDEAVAGAAEHPDGPVTLEWRRGGRRNLRFDNGASESYEAVFAGRWDRILVARDSVLGGPVAEHIARWDPARVLADCDAKRQIVERESRWWRPKGGVIASSGPDLNGMVSVTWDEGGGHVQEETVTSKEFQDRFTEPSPPSETLRLLALPYADHPDYREEWRP